MSSFLPCLRYERQTDLRRCQKWKELFGKKEYKFPREEVRGD